MRADAAGTAQCTAAPSPEKLKDLVWQHPLEFLTSGKIKGITDPRIMALILLLVMIVLYAVFG